MDGTPERFCFKIHAQYTANQRKKVILLAVGALVFFVVLVVAGFFLKERAMETDFSRKNMLPCVPYLFGTDWMGRDMFARTVSGLSFSILLGVCASVVSAGIALVLAAISACGKAADDMAGWLTDLMMGAPHIVVLILVSCALGKGLRGVAAGIALTHWPGLFRILRSEILQQKEAAYIAIARRLGKSRLYIVRKHLLPHLLPQLLAGLTLQFPHAILHEAGLTFLGFGLPPEEPAIGIILSESMSHLSTGKWWLALFPGLALAGSTVLFERIGNMLRTFYDPSRVQM